MAAATIQAPRARITPAGRSTKARAIPPTTARTTASARSSTRTTSREEADQRLRARPGVTPVPTAFLVAAGPGTRPTGAARATRARAPATQPAPGAGGATRAAVADGGGADRAVVLLGATDHHRVAGLDVLQGRRVLLGEPGRRRGGDGDGVAPGVTHIDGLTVHQLDLDHRRPAQACYTSSAGAGLGPGPLVGVAPRSSARPRSRRRRRGRHQRSVVVLLD